MNCFLSQKCEFFVIHPGFDQIKILKIDFCIDGQSLSVIYVVLSKVSLIRILLSYMVMHV